MSGRRYKAEDLRIGMIVSRYELADVYDLYVLLGDYNQKTQSGRIIHLCKREDRATDEEFSKIAKRDGVVSVHFQAIEEKEDLDDWHIPDEPAEQCESPLKQYEKKMNELFATPVPEGKMLKYEDLRIGMLATFHQVQNIEGVFIYFDEFDRKTSSGRIINYFKQSEKTEKDEQMTEYLSWKNNGLACYFCPEGEYYD